MSWEELSGEPKRLIAALLDDGDTMAARLTCRGWVDMKIAVKIVNMSGAYRSQEAQQEMQAELSTADRILLAYQHQLREELFNIGCRLFQSCGLRCSREFLRWSGRKSPPLPIVPRPLSSRPEERLVQCLRYIYPGLHRIDIYYLKWESLNPGDDPLRSGAMEELGRMTGLTHLELPGMDLEQAGENKLLLPFGGLTALETLNMANSQFHPDCSGGFSLRELPASLRRLYLTNTSLYDFEGISGLTGLRELRLDDVHGEHGLVPLEELAKLQELRVLNLAGCDNVPDDRSPLLPLVERLDELNLDGARYFPGGRTRQMDAFDAAAYCSRGMFLRVRTNHNYEVIPVMHFKRA